MSKLISMWGNVGMTSNISFGFIPVVGFDASPCEVLGFEDIVIGGGDTFDCYSESENVTILPLAGTNWNGSWVIGEAPFGVIKEETFETYVIGEAESQVMAGGDGFSGSWILSPYVPPPTAYLPVVEGDYRYIRLLISANNGDTQFVGVLELELRESASGANVASGGTASASGFTTWPASYAFNGLYGTGEGWAFNNNNVFPQWLQYDFGASVTKRIVEYRVGSYSSTTLTAARSSRLWKLQGSNDAVDWTDLHEVDAESLMGGWIFGEMRTLPLPL